MHAIGLGLGLGMPDGPRGLAPYLGNVATRTYLNRVSGFNSGLAGLSSRMAHWLRDNVSSIQLVYSNWYRDGALGTEVSIGNTLQIRASLETAGGTRTQVTFGGAAQGSVASGGNLVSDAIAWTGASGDKFYTRTQQLNAGGCCFLETGNSTIGDRLDFDSSDHTMSGTIADGLGGYTFGPSAILAMTRKRTMLLIGDSRIFGVGDTADSTGDMGSLARSVGPTNGYCNGGAPQLKASDFKNALAKTLAMAGYFSDVAIALGVNDSGNDATRLADILSGAAALSGAGRRIWGVTLDPFTSGAWNNADGSDQTVGADETGLNTLIKATPSPLYGRFDVAPSVSLASPTTKWHDHYTADGVHANQAANLARQAANAATIQAALA